MFGVECFDTHDEPISHYTQWDINQTLKIVLYGMDDGYMKNAPYVHFANIKSSEALVVRSTLQGDDTVLVDIPNQLLQEPYPLLIYVYLNDSSDASSQRTIVKIEIPVHKRARPSDYEYVENIDRITAEAIKQDIYDDFMDEVGGGNIAYPYVTFIDESTGKHVNLKVSDEKFGLYVDSTNRQLLDTGDIVNNLMTNSSTKALSASMGATIKNMVDVIPDNIDEKIEEHDSSPTSHSDIRDDISSVSSAVDTMQDSIAEIEKKIDDVGFMLDDTISGSGILTTTDTLVNSSPIEMRIKGNTRQNLWVNPIATKNGITIANADDGAITISGSATATTTVTTDKIYTMKAGVTYSIGADKLTPVNGFVFSVHQYSSADRLLAGSDSITYASKGRTITMNAQMAYVKFVVVIPSGTSVSETYHIMLNVGEELEPWCAPGLNSIDEVGVVTAGKNLLARMGPKLPYTTAGITFSDNGDGGIRISGTATATAYYNFFNTNTSVAPYITSGTYVASLVGGIMNSINLNVGYFDYGIGGDYTTWISTHVTGISSTGSIDRPAYIRAFISVASGATVNTVVYPQLELGSTATAYEPPNITTTSIGLDGHTLNSLPDGTCDELTIDATGDVTLTQRVGVFEATEETSWTEYAGQGNVNAYYTNTGMDAHSPTGDTLDAVDTKMMCDDFPCYQTLWHATVATPRVGMSDNTAYPKAMFYNSAGYGPAASDTRMTVLYPLATPQTIKLSSITLSSFPSDKSNIYTTSNIPTAGLTVRYWKKGGELVANLYKLLWNHEA